MSHQTHSRFLDINFVLKFFLFSIWEKIWEIFRVEIQMLIETIMYHPRVSDRARPRTRPGPPWTIALGFRRTELNGSPLDRCGSRWTVLVVERWKVLQIGHENTFPSNITRDPRIKPSDVPTAFDSKKCFWTPSYRMDKNESFTSFKVSLKVRMMPEGFSSSRESCIRTT